MNKCHMHKKVKKCKSQKLESLEEKSYDSSNQNFLPSSYESTLSARQFILYDNKKRRTMDLKISRTQTPKSQIQPKAAITKNTPNNSITMNSITKSTMYIWTTSKSIRKKQIQTSFPCGNHLSHQETNFNPALNKNL